MLPPVIPIFPLPHAVLFPNVFMPLHIFEPRYRAMVADALAGDRIVGMVLLKPGFETDYGVGMRIHTPAATVLRIDLARGAEGMRLVFATSAPF